MNLITLTLTLNSAAVVFAQIDSSTNSTCSSESNNQTGICKPAPPTPPKTRLFIKHILML